MLAGVDGMTGSLVTHLKAVNFVAESEREKARERTYDAMVRKARAGHVTGGACFGYRNVRRHHLFRETRPAREDSDSPLARQPHRVQALMGRAVDTLEELLGEKKHPNVRLGAARTVAELGMHQHDADTILRKLDEIETYQRQPGTTGTR